VSATAGPDQPVPDAAARRATLLEERARQLAEVEVEAPQDFVEVVPFVVAGERYAALADDVLQVTDAGGVWPLLGAPREVLGAALAHARLVPVLDLRRLLGLDGSLSDLQRVVVLQSGGEAFGIAAERVEVRRSLLRSRLTPATSGPFRYLSDDCVAVVDPARLRPAATERPGA
jgi:purine-binding chemotaxis protein CheW